MQSWEALDFTKETEPTQKDRNDGRWGEKKITLGRLRKAAEKKNRK